MKTVAGKLASPVRIGTLAMGGDAWDPCIGAATDIGALISEEINGIETVREECYSATADRAMAGNVDSALHLLVMEYPHNRGAVVMSDDEISDLLGTLGE